MKPLASAVCLAVVMLGASRGLTQQPMPRGDAPLPRVTVPPVKPPVDPGVNKGAQNQGGAKNTYGITFDDKASTKCGPGNICFKYTLPGGPFPGSVVISLAIYQNGNPTPVTTLTSPALTNGSANPYCFPINAALLATLNASYGGFDFVATGNFSTGNTSVLGTAPAGRLPGFNNDYQIACSKWCCGGENLIRNGDFENGSSGFTSQYTYHSGPPLANASLPGEYHIVTSSQALVISPNWVANDHAACNNVTGSKFMVVNGRTTQPTGTQKIIWKETLSSVQRGEYRFCANVKNLPQTTFDMKPKITVKFSGTGITAPAISAVVNAPAGACGWQLISGNVTVSASTSLTIEIWLDEDPLGDGNDLAIDDISLQIKPQVPVNYTSFHFDEPQDIGGGRYTIRVHYPANFPNSPNCGYVWGVCELDAMDQCIPSTTVSNPPQWWNLGNASFHDFDGYVGTSTLATPPQKGVFYYAKKYRVTFGAWCDCESLRSWSVDLNPVRKPQGNQPGAGGDTKSKPVPQPTRPDTNARPMPKGPPKEPSVPARTSDVKPTPTKDKTPPKREAVDPMKDKTPPMKDKTPPRKEPTDPMKDK